MESFIDKVSFAADIVKSKLLGTVVPLQVQLSVTNHCNLRCNYCYADYPVRSHGDLSLGDIFKIVDDLAGMGTRRINLVGGEPLSRPDIGEIINYIVGKKIQCALTTNGYLVPARMEFIKKLNVLCVSMDGDKTEHDANRGDGSFEKAFNAVMLAKKNKVPVQVACVITKKNLYSIEWILQKGKEFGFQVGFSTLVKKTVDGVKEVAPDIPTDDEYRKIISRILELKDEGYPVLFSKKNMEYALNWKYGFEKDRIVGEEPDFDHIKCNAGKNFGMIDVNGDVYPCGALVDTGNPVNGLEQGMAKAFDHASGHDCKTCHLPCMNEFNLMYSLDVSTIWNIVRNYKFKG
jgi:MoaA/NifB/PqqE/SkfB family radical SAM enzyme